MKSTIKVLIAILLLLLGIVLVVKSHYNWLMMSFAFISFFIAMTIIVSRKRP